MNQLTALPQILTLDPQTFVAATYETFTARLDAAKAGPQDLPDVSVAAGMKLAKERRATFRSIRTDLEKSRAAAKAPILEIGRLLDSKAKELAAQIVPLEDKFDAPIKAEEARIEAEKAAAAKAESDRQTKLQAAIDEIRNVPVRSANASAHDIASEMTKLRAILESIDDSGNIEEYQERTSEARYIISQILPQMESMLSGAKAREELAAQLEAQRIENEHLARIAAEEKASSEARQREEQEAQARILAEMAAALKAEQEVLARQQAELVMQRAEIEAQKQAAAQKTIDEAAAKAKAEQDAKLKAIEEASKSLQLTPDETVDVMREMGVDEQIAVQPLPRPSDKAIIMAVATAFDVSEWKARCWIIEVAASVGE